MSRAIAKQCAAVLTTVTGFPFILASQRKLRAPRPVAGGAAYGTVEIGASNLRSATPFSRMAADSDQKSMEDLRVGSLIVNVYGDDAEARLQGLQLSIRRRSVRSDMHDRTILITPGGGVVRGPIVRDTNNEEHAVATFGLQFPQLDIEAMERIETLETTLIVKGSDETELETLTITVLHTDTPP